MIYSAKESTSKRGLACADTCTFIYNRKIAIAWKKINEQREYNEKQQHKLHNNLKALKTVVHRPPPCVLLLLLLHTSIQNRSSISIHVIPKHTYTLIYHYQHNKFYELFVEMASTFLAPKIIFCSQTSRHGVIIIIIISHTMSMKWTLWKFYVADTIQYDTIRYGYVLFTFKYRHLSSNSSILPFTLYNVHIQKPDEWLSPFYFEYCCCCRGSFTVLFRFVSHCFQCKKLNAISQCFCVRNVMWLWCVMYLFHQIHNNAHNLHCR